MIDVNVNVSRWPFRRLPHDETPKLVHKLKACGITQAWVGSFDGLLHCDVAAVNARLVDECRKDVQVPGCLIKCSQPGGFKNFSDFRAAALDADFLEHS